MSQRGLADELFRLVEADQGYAHISDGIDVLTDTEILDLAEQSMKRHLKCAKLIKDFLSRHRSRGVLPLLPSSPKP